MSSSSPSPLPKQPASSPDLLVLLQSGLTEEEKAKHTHYLENQHIDTGKTDEFQIGGFAAHGFQTKLATKQLAKRLDRANTPSIQDKVMEILRADDLVQSVEANQEMHTCKD